MHFERFETQHELTQKVVVLLKEQFLLDTPRPHAVMLSGGSTPMPAYREIARNPVVSSSSTRLFFSDERLVPLDSPENNCANAKDMLDAVGLAPENLIRVQSNLDLEEAARKFHLDLSNFLNEGGRVTLGLLGLGADGHTASLFSQEDVQNGAGRLAQAVRRPDPPDRVSVTRDLLLKIERVIFLASGPAKTRIVERFLSSPQSLPAGQALGGVKNTELWVA